MNAIFQNNFDKIQKYFDGQKIRYYSPQIDTKIN